VDGIGPGLVRFLTLFLRGDAHAAHDVAQEVFVRAWGQRAAFESAAHLRRWAFRVARCKAISWIRQRSTRGRTVFPLEGAGGTSGVADGADRRTGRAWATAGLPPEESDALGALRRAIRRLPDTWSGPVHLHYLQGYSTRQTAELLGISRESVKMRLHRARRFLIREISRETGEPPHAESPARDP
jgi:RNA polymerase sigma-70 factor (ECF subfamily)